MIARSAVAAVLVLGLAGCADGAEHRAAPTRPVTSAPAVPVTSAPAAPLGAPGCDPPSPIRPGPAANRGAPEVRGTGRGAELWGLLLMRGEYPPLPAGEEVKIVWRMTGTGPLRLTLTGPGGEPHRPAWGPEEHGGSNYDRPGDEWGTGLLFTEPGCWHLRAVRDDAAADVWFKVG